MEDGNHDVEAIRKAVEHAKSVTDKPSIIAIQTTIGFGAPNQDTSGVHGSPLGWDKIDAVRAAFGFEAGKYFEVADDVLRFYREAGERGAAKDAAWTAMMQKYQEAYPAEVAVVVQSDV